MKPAKFILACVSRDMPNLDYTPIVNRLNENRKLMRLLHAAIGISGESGEILDSLKKCMIYGKDIDKNILLEECGDVLYYMAVMLHELNSSFEEVMEKNNSKLEKRYPSGFTEKDAIERKDKK